MRCQATDLLRGLSHPFAQLRALPLEALPPRLEQFALSGNRGFGRLPLRVSSRALEQCDVRKPLAFREQPRIAGHIEIEL